VPAAVDEGLSRRQVLRWPFDADLAVAALDRTTVDVPLLHRQLKLLHHDTSSLSSHKAGLISRAMGER
jgi:hypothetical protein